MSPCLSVKVKEDVCSRLFPRAPSKPFPNLLRRLALAAQVPEDHIFFACKTTHQLDSVAVPDQVVPDILIHLCLLESSQP